MKLLIKYEDAGHKFEKELTYMIADSCFIKTGGHDINSEINVHQILYYVSKMYDNILSYEFMSRLKSYKVTIEFINNGTEGGG